jgi:hypothetical protein
MWLTSPGERIVIFAFITIVMVAGAIFGYFAGGMGEPLFIAGLCGIGAFLGAYLPARSMAKFRQP